MKNLLRYPFLLGLLFLSLLGGKVMGQVSITAVNTPSTQNFDAVSTTLPSALPSGWKVAINTTSPTYSGGTATLATANTVTANTGSPTTGALYIWGFNAVNTDLAVGAMTSGGFSTDNNFMVAYTNNTGSTITNFNVSADVERYRRNTVACTTKIQYSTDGSTWNDISGASTIFATGTSTYTFTNPVVQSIVSNQSSISIANGATIYLNFAIITAGSSNSQGVGIDNVNFVANPTTANTNNVFARFNCSTNNSTNTSFSFTTTDASITTTPTLTMGSAFTSATATATQVRGNATFSAAACSSAVLGLANGYFYSWTMASTTNAVNYSGARFKVIRGSGGLASQLFYSTNGGSSFTPIGSAPVTSSGVSTQLPIYDLSSIGTVNANTTVIFRLVFFGGTTTHYAGFSSPTNVPIASNTGLNVSPDDAIVLFGSSISNPTISLPTATSVTSSGATLGGTIASTFGLSGTRGIVYALTSANATPTIGGTGCTNSSTSISAISSSTAFTEATSIGTAGAYTYRAYVTAGGVTVYTSTGTFTIPKAQPSAQASITSTGTPGTGGTTITISAGTGGDGRVLVINDNNSFADPVDGTAPSLSAAGGNYSVPAFSGTTSGRQKIVDLGNTTSVTLSGLASITQYYVRVYEYSNSSTLIDYLTTSPGSGTFTTTGGASAPSGVNTTTATSVTSSAASSGGDYSSTGGASITATGVLVFASPTAIDYSAAIDNVTKFQFTGSTLSSPFTVSISGLNSNTTYNYASYAENSAGVTLGSTKQFTTQKVAPTTQANNITFTNTFTTYTTANWTRGNGDSVLVIMNTTNSFTSPSGAGSGYVANPVYGSGQQVMYKGTGTSVAITGLAQGTTYYVKVFEFNGGSTYAAYNTADGVSNNPFSATTVVLTTLNRFNASTVTSAVSTLASNGSATNTTVGSLTMGSGLTTPFLVTYGVAAYGSTTSTNAAAALTNGHYFQTTIDANSGYGVNLSSIDGRLKRGSTGPNNYQFYYYIGSSPAANGSNFTAINSSFVYNTTSTNGDAFATVNTTGITGLQGAQSGSTVYIRLYFWGGTDFTNTTNGYVSLGRSATTPGTTASSASTFDILSIAGSVVTLPTVSTTATSIIRSTTATMSGNVLTTVSLNTTRGVVYGTSTSPTIAGSKTTNAQVDAITGAYDDAVTGLTPNTLYYYRAYVSNGNGVGYGSQLTFTTLKVEPTVQATSISASGITSAGATVSVTAGNGDGRYVIINTSNSFTDPTDFSTNPGTATNSYTYGGSGEGAFNLGTNTSFTLAGLSATTQYYIRVYEYSNSGTSADFNVTTATGNPGNFTTISTSAPTLAGTTAATSITNNGSISGGNVSSDGNSAITERGVVVSTSTSPTITDTKFTSAGTTGSYSTTISGLAANTIFYARAFATNAIGTSYGNQVSFKTLKAEPATQASSVTIGSITTTTASVSWTRGNGDSVMVIITDAGSVTAPTDGTLPGTGTAAYSGSGDQVIYIGTGTSVAVTGLLPGSTYFVQAFEYTNSATTPDYNINTATNNPNSFTTTPRFLTVALGGTYTQNFDALSNTGTSNTFTAGTTPLTGWYVGRNGGADALTYYASDGTTTASQAIASFGSTGSTDRALGSSPTTNNAGDCYIGMLFRNTTGGTIAKIRVQGTLEQWRRGDESSSSFVLEGKTYSSLPAASEVYAASGGYTAFSSVSISAPNTTTGITQLDGTLSGNRANFDQEITLTSTLASGSYIFVRFRDPKNNTGNNDGLGVDDLTFSWKAPAPDIALSVSGTGVATGGTLDFGTAAVGGSTTKTITVTNTGTVPLTISTVTLGGTNSSEFSLGSLPTTIAAGATGTFDVTLNRTVSNASIAATVTVASDASTTPSYVVNLTGVANNSAASTITLNTAGSSTITTSSNSSGTSLLMMSFDVNDDILNSSIDALPTKISGLVFRQGGTNTASNWTQGIAGVKLVNGATELTGTVNSSNLTFTSIPNTLTTDLGYVADNATKTIELRIWVNTGALTAVKSAFDGLRVVTTLDLADITTGVGGSTVGAASISSGSSNGLVSITGTALNYTVQPSAVNTYANLSPVVVVEVVDAFGFRDKDANSLMTITSTNTTVQNNTATPSSGLATFTTLQMTSGAPGGTQLVASYAGFGSTVTSSSFAVTFASLATGQFRFVASSGSLTSASNWESRATGSDAWVTATSAPGSTATYVEVSANNSASLTSALTVKSLLIASGATLTLTGSGAITFNTDGNSGTNELEVAGTLVVNGSNTNPFTFSSATANFQSGSSYQHRVNAGTILTATWNANSTCQVVNPGTGTAPSGGAGQSFGNVILDYSATSATVNLLGGFTNVAGNLSVITASGRETRFLNTGTVSITVGGNFSLSGGGNYNLSNGTGVKTLNIGGNFTIASGTTFNAGTTSGHIVQIGGNYTDGASGAYTPTNISYMEFDGTTPQTITTGSTTANFGMIRINNTAALDSNKKVTINQNMNVSGSGAGITLVSGYMKTGSFTIDLGASGTLSGENSTGTMKVLGKVSATRTLALNTANTCGGIGISLNTVSTSAGSTVVTRTTGVAIIGGLYNTRKSIKRQFSITPTTNSGLNATMVFSYTDDELNGIAALSLGLVKSTNSGSTWVYQNGATVNSTNKTITLTGISGFSDWTATDAANPLPVTLTYFSGKASDKGNVLTWQTATEINNQGFNIERSENGTTFTRIAFVKGNGNSNSLKNYTYLDAGASTAYYRLVQVDFDGTATTSQVIYVGSGSNDNWSAKVAPNPLSENSYISVVNLGESSLISAQIVSATGHISKVYNGTVYGLNGWFAESNANLASGVYTVVLQSNEVVKTLRVVKK